jgi:hypothetical protein
MKMYLALVGSLLLGTASGYSAANEARGEGASRCSVRDATGLTRVVLCPRGLSDEQLRVAGEAACGKVEDCSAWIWDDAALAPTALRDDEREVDPRYAHKAVAVWFNHRKGLLKIRPIED